MASDTPNRGGWRWKVLLAGWVLPLVVLGIYVSLETPPQVAWVPQAPLELAVAVEQAEALLQSGKQVEAQAAFEALRARAPLDPLILARLADVYRLSGDRARAAAALTLALERDATLGEAAYNLACDRATLGQTDDALWALRLAINSGLDVRTPLSQDPELASVRTLPVVQRFLAGASGLPETERSAHMELPRAPVFAQAPFLLKFELEASGNARTELPLEVRLVYAGDTRTAPRVQRLDQTLQRTRGEEGGGWERVQWRLTLSAEAEGLLLLGPWNLLINGVQVPMKTELLVIQPPSTMLPEAVSQEGLSGNGAGPGPGGEPVRAAPEDVTPVPSPPPLPPEKRLETLLRLELPPVTGP